jgi:hypothetical protein
MHGLDPCDNALAAALWHTSTGAQTSRPTGSGAQLWWRYAFRAVRMSPAAGAAPAGEMVTCTLKIQPASTLSCLPQQLHDGKVGVLTNSEFDASPRT